VGTKASALDVDKQRHGPPPRAWGRQISKRQIRPTWEAPAPPETIFLRNAFEEGCLLSFEDMTEVWAARIGDYRASGERVAAWCERNEVTPHQLYYWMRKLRKAERQVPPASEQKWVALSLEESSTSEAPPIVIKIGAVTVEVQAGFDPSAFAAVVRTLKTLC